MTTPLRVLLVEDSEDDALLLIEALREGDFDPRYRRVETEADLRTALAEEAWDIILADYVLPRFSGIAAVRLLQESGLDIPVIMVSGKAGEEHAVEAMRAGADDYILKGHFARLMPAVERELQEARSRHERRVAEEALRESEARFRSLFEENQAVMLLIDPDSGQIQDANYSASAYYGYTREVLCNMTIWEINTLPREEVLAEMAKARVDERRHFLFKHRLATGEVRDVEVYSGPVAVAGKTLLYSIVFDVTERKRAEEERERLLDEVKRRVAELDAIIVSIADGLVVNDVDGRIVIANPAAEALLGTPSAQWHIPFTERWKERHIYQPDGREVPLAEFPALRALRGEVTRNQILRVQIPARPDVWLSISAAPIQTPERKIQGAVTIFADLSAFYQLQQERERLLAEVERRVAELDSSLTSIADGLILYSPALRVIRMNAAAEAIFNMPRAEFDIPLDERFRLLRITHADGRPFAPEDIPAWRAVQGETVRDVIEVLHRPDGQTVWVSGSAAPVCTPDGTLIGVISTFTNITRLHQLQEERAVYIHTISHDLRAPLSAILGYGQLMKDQVEQQRLDELLHASVDAILRSAQRMNVMIQDMVDAARWEGAQLELQLRPVALRSYLEDLLKRNATVLEIGRIRLALPDDLPSVSADGNRLERIFINLLSNALKYSDPGTPVLLRAMQEGSEVVVAVADQGRGIPPEDLPHLFERFYRAKGTRTTEGIGLGLYITRVLVEAQGGRIWVESVVGVGSTFCFTLPVAEEK